MTARGLSHNRPAGRLYALLVLAVLAGVLGMHALPVSPLPTAHADRGHTMDVAHAQNESAAAGQCAHTAGGTGHLDHADQTCAATGVGSSYTPPALSAAFTDVPAAAAWSDSVPESAASSRAPPDLSQLQLLRI
ncbi:DUF6153 family protein [Streptomyces sp. NPDC058665]|uniref:DUF6153 family protein n=1 Tax=Streptomyces sp. NPDC058665 TaxID=3346586 RepID=UPI00364D5D21